MTPKIKIELPDEERGVSPYHISQFDRLTRKAERERDPKKREEILDDRLALETQPRRNREEAAIAKGIAETIALAIAKGEEVKQTSTGPRIVSRGGLAQAYGDGHLEPLHGPIGQDDLYQAGKDYRDAYEIVEGMTSSSGQSSGFGPKAPQLRLIEAGADLLRMRAVITERQRQVLDLVCGKDMRLRAAATELHRGFPATRNALRGGLHAIAGLKPEKADSYANRIALIAAAITQAQQAP